MSPDTKRLGDLHELPACAPEGLKALVTIAEGMIQTQVTLLGEGKPSQAPDLRELLRDKGISKPEDQSTMVDNYNQHQEDVDEVKSGIHSSDDGITVRTAGIGKIITDAYDAVDKEVGELNGLIDASFTAVQTLKDEQGKEYKKLPNHIVDGLFTATWEALNTTFEEVSGVSDRAAAQALAITADEPNVPVPNGGGGGGGGGGGQPVAYGGSGSGGSDPSFDQVSYTGDAPPINPTGETPGAMEIMQYLIERHNFTPAQAAGAVANAWFESKFKVGAEGDLDLADTAHGLFQWRAGRYERFKNFADTPDPNQDPDLPPRSRGNWRTHIDYMVHELKSDNSYQNAENSLYRNANNAEAVAEDFDRFYEISSGSTLEQRGELAKDLVKQWNSQPSTALA
ncbi:phage tail tip lysozyme [Nocardia grenadensis]|uniref:phage tail tip lysozyme n=1 Tax=Nocardia grenadensis TaxID=931537 RepID=UPI003D75F491